MPRYSLVIPAWNEEAYLPRLLETVGAARARYSPDPDAIEVIVADNASTDATPEVARRAGTRVVRVEERRIASVRNGGAAAARGEVLAFVDADFRIHPETFVEIDKVLATGRVVGGASGVRMERWSPGILATWCVMVPMVVLAGMDTGVVFCRREDFEAIGGYNEARYFAEDVELLVSLRRLGRTRRQKLARLRRAKAITSTRKFDQHGDWHYFSLMARGSFAMLFRPSSFDRFVRRYWYEREDVARSAERETRK